MPDGSPTAAVSTSVVDDADLWLIIAIIQPFKVDAVTLALEDIPGFGGMTVSDCRGFGHGKVSDEGAEETAGEDGSKRDTISARGSEIVDFTPKVRLEIAVAGRERADRVVETIGRSAHTGRRGDGKIFALPLSVAVRVRTFDKGASAL